LLKNVLFDTLYLPHLLVCIVTSARVTLLLSSFGVSLLFASVGVTWQHQLVCHFTAGNITV